MKKLTLCICFFSVGAAAYACSSKSTPAVEVDAGGFADATTGADTGAPVCDPFPCVDDDAAVDDTGTDAGVAVADSSKPDGTVSSDGGFPHPLPDGGTATVVATGLLNENIFYDGVTWLGDKVLFSDVGGNNGRYTVLPDGTALTGQPPFLGAIGNAVQGTPVVGAPILFTAFSDVGRIDKVGQVAPFATGFGGQPFNQPNDIIVHSSGNLYVTDPSGYTRDGLPSRVYRITSAGVVSVALDYVSQEKVNGIALSPDEKTLYLGITDLDIVVKHAVKVDFSLDVQAPFATLPPGSTPDGLAVDDAGNVYISITKAAPPGAVLIYNALGAKIGTISVPRVPVVSMGFGGADRKSLFIVAGDGNATPPAIPTLYKIVTAVPGKP